jgi:hypothetical protein
MLFAVVAVALISAQPFGEPPANLFYHYQTIIGGILAIVGALIGARYINKQIRSAERLELRRVESRREAARAVLPLTLSSITEYATDAGRAMLALIEQCNGETLPATIAMPVWPKLPTDAITALKELAENSRPNETVFVARLLSALQIQNARTRDLERELTGQRRSTLKVNLESYLIDAGESYARATALFEYARREADHFPTQITWEGVRQGVWLISVHHPSPDRVYESIGRLSGGSLKNIVRDR